MKPLIFSKNTIHIKIYNYKFEVLGELRFNKYHNKYDFVQSKGKFISIPRMKEIIKYHDDVLMVKLNEDNK